MEIRQLKYFLKVAEVNKVSDAEYVLAPGMYICNGKKFVIK